MGKKILQISPYDFAHLGGVEKYAEILDEIFTKNYSHSELDKENSAFKSWKFASNFSDSHLNFSESSTLTSENRFSTENTEDSGLSPEWQIIFSTISGGKDFEILEPVKNCPLPKFWTPHFWKFVKKIRENPPKIIISHIRFAPTAWFAFWFSKSINAKYIHIEHGTGFLVHSNFFIKNIAKIVDLTIGKYILKNADFVVTISQAGENWVKNFTGRTKNIETIYRGFKIMKNEEWKMKNLDKKNPPVRGDGNFEEIFKGDQKNWGDMKNLLSFASTQNGKNKNFLKNPQKSPLNPPSQWDLQKNFWKNCENKIKTCQNQELQGNEVFSNGVYYIVNDREKTEINDEVRRFSQVLKIGFVGRLTPLKNLNSLFMALSKISFTNWQLEIVWDGEMRWEWEKLAKNLWISEKIIFLGARENSWILENFLANIDIFVNPSLQEWLPTTVIEAKIAGCKVLATDVGGIREIPDITLCEPTETDLKEKLEKILNNFLPNTSTGSVWQKISHEFKNKFSLEKMRENYEKIFEKI